MHLSLKERVVIQTRIKGVFSLRAITRKIGCSHSTISYKVRRSTVLLYHNKQKRYKGKHGNDVYQTHRKNYNRQSDLLKKAEFLKYVYKHPLKMTSLLMHGLTTV